MDQDHQPTKRMRLENPILWPILPESLTQDLPLIDVYIGTIKNPKTTSQVIVQLNAVLPIDTLVHLKRVNRRKILLYPTSKSPEDLLEKLKENSFDIDLLENNFEIVKVAEIPPKTRKQYETVHKLWPCNFHSNHYLEKLCTNQLFSDFELNQHVSYMKIAILIAKIAKTPKSTLIVDPNLKSIVAFGFEDVITCPVRHSIMVAIDNVAKTQNGGQWLFHEKHQEIQKIIQEKFPKIQFGTNKNEKNIEEGPYLCTGYEVYSTFEPCIMCAMALIHSRAKRVFYGAPEPQTGGLGSLCKIHCVENLNHHYEVFAGLLQAECELLSKI